MACTMKAYRRSSGIAPFTLNLGTRQMQVVNFMPLQLIPNEEEAE